MTDARTIFESLAGRWRIYRHIASEMPAGRYSAKGTAQFARSDNQQLLYTENIDDGGLPQVKSKQEYIYRFDEQNNQIIKYFKDNRLFYALDMNTKGNKARGAHKCIADLYTTNYIFTCDGFTLACTATGPSKKYKSTTRYLRI